MRSRFLLVVGVCSWVVMVGSALPQDAEVDQAQLAATHQLLRVMELERTYTETIEAMVDVQIDANPTIAPFRDVMMRFFGKYMSWESLEDDIAKIYAEAFTAPEIKELTTFYESPVGNKAALLLPELTRQGAALGQKRVQEHMPELHEMIAEEYDRINGKEPAPKKEKPDDGK